jgi:uncharacterized delta-60 repeat protein
MSIPRRFGLRILNPLPRRLGAAICSLAAATVCCAQSPLPDGFNPGAIGPYLLGLGGQQPSSVNGMAVQADGKILVAGDFVTLGGMDCTNFGRLNADGSVDTLFCPAVAGNHLAVQPDGKIVVGGLFGVVAGGQSCSNLARLNPDGTLDAGFVNVPNNVLNSLDVESLALQRDGKLLVIYLSPQFTNCLERLNADGSLDTSFNPVINGFTNVSIAGVLLQPDGRILLNTMTYPWGAQSITGLIRLNPDGTLDSSFNPPVIGESGGEEVSCTALQADGKIIVGGHFSTLDGLSVSNIARLNTDGTVDTNFNANTDSGVFTLALQANGKIIVGGFLTLLDGATNYLLGRLNSDGSLDASFNPEISFSSPNSMLALSPAIFGLAVQPDGKVLVGGVFSALAGQTRICIGRLNSSDPVTNSLSLDGSSIVWWRGGDSPEVEGTSFDSYTPGTGWVNLGSGTRIPGGWQLTGAPLQSNATVRARGYTAQCGYYDSSSWFVETVQGPPVLGLGLSGGVPLLNLTGEAGRQFDIQYLPSLATNNSWQFLTEFALTNSEHSVVDSNAGQRFYRAMMSQ